MNEALPLIRIRAEGPGAGINLGEIWRFRELLFSFCSRELTVRHKQTLLGPAWLVLQPLLQAAVFAMFMHGLARVPSDGGPYPIFAYAGLLPWLFFSTSIQSLSYGLMMNAHLVSRVYFPRVIIPLSMILVRLVDFASATVSFLVIAGLAGVHFGWKLVLLPAFMIQAGILCFGLGAWGSCLIARYRDFGTLLPVVLQLAMFASPVIYPSSLVPAPWREVYFLNPVAAIVEGFRAALLGRPIPTGPWMLSLLMTGLVVALALREFSRLEERSIEAL